MFAARAVPLGLAAGLLPFFHGGPAMAWLLFVAAAAQTVDVAIAAAKRERGMAAGASLGALVHVACGLMVR